MTTFIPRFRGLAVQKPNRAWGWELLITIGPVGPEHPDPICMSSKQDFISRASALKDLEATVPGVMKEVCKAMGLGEPTGIHDLQQGTMSKFDEWGHPPKEPA